MLGLYARGNDLGMKPNLFHLMIDWTLRVKFIFHDVSYQCCNATGVTVSFGVHVYPNPY